VLEIKEKVARIGFKRNLESERYLSENFLGWRRVFEVIKGKGSWVVRERARGLAERVEWMGYTLYISNRDLRPKEVIYLYRQKDLVEKCFNNIKNELGANRLRVHSREVMEGRLFINFVKLILYSWIGRVMREKKII